MDEIIKTLEKLDDFLLHMNGFAVNAFDNEGKKFLEETKERIGKLGGKIYIEHVKGFSWDPEGAKEIGDYSDTMWIWLPYLNALPVVIHHAEMDYMRVMDFYADEKDIYFAEEAFKEDSSGGFHYTYKNVEEASQPGIAIRFWWD